MNIGFVVREMTYLKYFVPLIIELNNREHKSEIFICSSKKYSCPYSHLKYLIALSKFFHFKIKDISEKNNNDLVFVKEGCGARECSKNIKKISLVSLYDFNYHYDSYINFVDFVVFPSRFFAEYYRKVNAKNLYLGSPKYDLSLIKEDILKKYNLSAQDRFASVFSPNTKEIKNINLKRINDIISSMGYKVIIKTRGKFPVFNKSYRGDRYFEDFSWFPPSSLELIKISDFIVSFDSTTIKEAIMLNTPIINFHIRGINRRLPFLYNYDFCFDLPISFTDNQLIDGVNKVSSINFDNIFNIAKANHLFVDTNVSKKILDVVL